MAIFLVRHGETASNVARIVQLPDEPLSARGRAQAARLAARLADLGVAAIVTSDLPRARSTAEVVAAATGAPLEVWPELRERDFGELRGRAYATLEVDLFAPDLAPPGGETWATFEARVERAWERVRERARSAPGNLAVVTHGLVCRAIVERLTTARPLVAPANASLTIVSAGADAAHVVELVACTAHLDRLP